MFILVWVQALDKAAKSTHDGPTTVDFTEYYVRLNLDKNENPTTSQINRAYRKAALKSHPDKGGSVDEVISSLNC